MIFTALTMFTIVLLCTDLQAISEHIWPTFSAFNMCTINEKLNLYIDVTDKDNISE